ncbi:GNAT family N-acetyltransferase [Bosea sp. OK403]|uniref:GNAT family N-acetyltransferase n=1 Tax=Bosea sp. OK403 TaxID=1855286 RepID=UPI001587BA8F|nr:GNAT family N-acetyltransferase [Bosea sp. OK403]
MTALPELKTARLALRPRQLADLDAIAMMNADPEVMRYIAPIGDPAMGRDGIAARSFAHLARGLGYWSVFPAMQANDVLDAELIGYVGLIPDGEVQQVQLSYRFAARHWGKGHGFEAVSRLLGHGFETLALPEIVIVTHPQNAASLRLAKKLGFEPAPSQAETLIGAPPVVATRLRLERPR